MYLRILLKDLKRKKAMNCIILLFVVLSAMFFASGVNNIISIAAGLDHYLDMAGMGDYIILVGEPTKDSPFEKSLNECPFVTGHRRESVITVIADNVTVNGMQMDGFSSSGMLLAPDIDAFHYFDMNNELIEAIPGNEVYITNSIAKKAGLSMGDAIDINISGKSFGFTFAGVCKDAAMGSDMMDNPRFLISKNAFDEMMAEEAAAIYHHSMYYVDTTDIRAVENIISTADGVRFYAERSMIKTSYIVNTLIAGVIMAVSICLILIAFAVLRFTISLGITEEFREIGVMKAVGLKNRSIRSLYLIKYLGLAVIGALIGLAAAFPFGDMLLGSVSENMIITNDHEVLINIISCIIVIGIILLFCWGCTSKIKKLSPVDAVRNGQTGERFRKHGTLSFSKTSLGANSFISLNDVLSSPGQTAVITAIFTLCSLLVMILSSTAETLSSDKLIYMIGVTKSDVYYVNQSAVNEIIGGSKTIEQTNEEVRTILSDNGLSANVHSEAIISATASYNDRDVSIRLMWCPETSPTDYYYAEGTAPLNSDEIALTYVTAKDIGAGIGDTLEVSFNNKTERFIITALYDSFNGLGYCGKLNNGYHIPDTSIVQLMAYQIDFDDDPDTDTINHRIEMIKDIFGSKRVFDKAGFVNDCTKAADAVRSVKDLTLAVALIIIILITVLMERSFISKETAEIALMKAIGFKSRSLICIHVLRFMIITAISIVAAAVISTPATKLIMDPIFAVMGASSGIEYAVNGKETFLIFPAVIFAAVTAVTFITALYTKTVKASDTAAIE